jgi:galactitol-specific phosphotransferase system IIC component
VVDLKRLYRTGLARVGNIDLLETSEEQTMRQEVGTSTASKWSHMIGIVLGLLIGVIAGYVGLYA